MSKGVREGKTERGGECKRVCITAFSRNSLKWEETVHVSAVCKTTACMNHRIYILRQSAALQ